MLNKRLAVISAVAISMAASNAMFAAQTNTKPTPVTNAKPANQVTKPATPVTPPAGVNAKAQAENIKKFKNAPDSTVVAVVDGVNITKGELMGMLWDWASTDTLGKLINYKVVTQAAKKQGIVVTQADVDKKIAELAKEKNQTSEQFVSDLLRQTGFTKNYLDAYMTISLNMEKMALKESPITDAEYSSFIKARMIAIRLSTDTEQNPTPDAVNKAQAEAKAKADKVCTELKVGKPFADVAKEYSDDPNSRNKGGEVGWIRQSASYSEVTDAAFKLKAGEVSEPIKTQFGYIIVKVDAVGKDATGPEKEELKSMLLQEKVGGKVREIFTKINSTAKVENYLAPAAPVVKKPVPTPVN